MRRTTSWMSRRGERRAVALRDRIVLAPENCEPAQLLDRDQPRAQTVVDIVVVVGDLVGHVCELRLEARLRALVGIAAPGRRACGRSPAEPLLEYTLARVSNVRLRPGNSA
jgi:hypothetical protein